MQNEIDINKKMEIIEAVLFAAGHPVTYDKLADILEITPSAAKELVTLYEEKYNNTDLPRGVQLIRFDKACQLCTKSEYESYVKLALGIKQGRGNLSNSSLEVLAIIAYNQPVTRAFAEQVRGVDSSGVISTLVEKGLIEVAPLAYMRGRTLDRACVILDEAQNTNLGQLKMFLTRMGCDAKFIVTGDASQKDLAPDMKSGLDVAEKVLHGIDDIAFCNLTNKDVVRHPLVQKIVKAYDDYESRQARYREKENAREGRKDGHKIGDRNDKRR